MTTLKLLWRERNDMRRVQVVAVNQALLESDGRPIDDVQQLRYANLRDYTLLVFPELHSQAAQLVFSYQDDEDEQITITNDQELEEAMRLMEMLSKGGSAVCRITIHVKPLQPQDAQDRVMRVLVDMGHLLEKWQTEDKASQSIKPDLLTLFREPACLEVFAEILSQPKYAAIFDRLTMEFQQGCSLVSTVQNAMKPEEIDQLGAILTEKIPHRVIEVDRILKHFSRATIVTPPLSSSDFFESIPTPETRADEEERPPPSAIFEKDISMPDGAILTPLEPFDKVWRVRNVSKEKWPEGVKLICVGGDKMGAPDSLPIPSVAGESFMDISLRMTAPSQPGRYTGYWRLITGEGVRFGQRLWVDVNVTVPQPCSPKARSPIHAGEIRVDAPSPMVCRQSGNTVQVPAPASVPLRPAPVDQSVGKWQNEIVTLEEMGFTNREQNLELLGRHNGDVNAVIGELLN